MSDNKVELSSALGLWTIVSYGYNILATRMAKFHFPPPPPFLAAPRNPVIPWKRWSESFETYLMASGLDDQFAPNARKGAILLHCFRTEGQRIFASFTDSDWYDGARCFPKKILRAKTKCYDAMMLIPTAIPGWHRGQRFLVNQSPNFWHH